MKTPLTVPPVPPGHCDCGRPGTHKDSDRNWECDNCRELNNQVTKMLDAYILFVRPKAEELSEQA